MKKMTVGELIEALRQFPSDRRVVVDGYEHGFDDPVIQEKHVKPHHSPDWWEGKLEETDKETGERVVCIARPDDREEAL